MNKRVHIASLVLMGLLTTVLFSACGPDEGSKIEKPGVAFVPEQWYLSDEEPYSELGDWGLIEYTDDVDYDFVQIWYGDLPTELEGKETDEDALIDRAIYEAITFEPTETGTMTIDSRLAGYVKAYDAEYDVYEMEIVFVYESTYVDIYTVYDATSEDEEQAMSLIRSIHF